MNDIRSENKQCTFKPRTNQNHHVDSRLYDKKKQPLPVKRPEESYSFKPMINSKSTKLI